MDFYTVGKNAAFHKIGLLKQIGKTVETAMKPGTSNLLKRLGVGAGLGGATGAITGGEDNRLQGALLGAAGGAALGGAAPKGRQLINRMATPKSEQAAARAFGNPKKSGKIITDPAAISRMMYG
jgi:hypothetical protein